MWKALWRSLLNERGQEPSSGDEGGAPEAEISGGSTERVADDDSFGVRTPYDENTPDAIDSTTPEQTNAPQAAQQAQTGEEPYLNELNLDPSTFTPEMQEVFKRMQAAHTKKMQKFKSFEGHLQNMDRFYNDRSFAEQTLRAWAEKNGLNLVPAQFNQQQPAPQEKGVNALQAKLVETLKSRLPAETQWMADGQGAAIFQVMQDVLGPVLQEFQGFKTAKQENDWKTLETEYDTTEQEFAAKYPGWEAHEDEMSDMLSFLNDTKAYRHPTYGSKHELLYKLVTGNANALKAATARLTQAKGNRTPSSRPGSKGNAGGFSNIQDEVAATADRNDAFAKAANSALNQLKRRK